MILLLYIGHIIGFSIIFICKLYLTFHRISVNQNYERALECMGSDSMFCRHCGLKLPAPTSFLLWKPGCQKSFVRLWESSPSPMTWYFGLLLILLYLFYSSKAIHRGYANTPHAYEPWLNANPGLPRPTIAWHKTLSAFSRIHQSLTVARSDLQRPWEWTILQHGQRIRKCKKRKEAREERCVRGVHPEWEDPGMSKVKDMSGWERRGVSDWSAGGVEAEAAGEREAIWQQHKCIKL